MNTDEQKKRVIIVTEGKEEERDLSGLLEGEEFVYLGRCPYLWQGEERIEHEEIEGLHSVNGKIYGVDLDKADIKSVSAPEDITSISLSGEHLQHLTSYPNLLALSAHDVEGAQMKHLAETSKLRILDLALNSNITDEGLSHVSELNDIRWLNLLKTPISDAGLTHLVNLSMLSVLWLVNTNITGKGLKHLAGLTRLESLGISGTAITDDDLAYLEGLSNLRVLHLAETSITDAGVKYLAHLTELEDLNIKSTRITDEGARKLKKALPGCEISV